MSWRVAYTQFWGALARVHPGGPFPPTDPGRNGAYLAHPRRQGIQVYVSFNDTRPADRSMRDLVVAFYDPNRALNRYLPLDTDLAADHGMQDVRLDVAEEDARVWVAKRTVQAAVARGDLLPGPTCDAIAQRAATEFERFLRF